jgi:hypothetical protein
VRFFISGEIDGLIYDVYRPIRQIVERQLNDALGDKDYGSALKSIGIIPIIMRPEWKVDRKERKLFQRKQQGADYRLHIDFERFQAGDSDVRLQLLLRNIIASIEDLQRKAGHGFRGQELVDDILSLFHYDREELSLD